MNVLVVSLSFLALGERAWCPLAARSGAPLSACQWRVVGDLMDMVKQWCPASLFSEGLACGRKGTDLSDSVALVEEFARGLAPPDSAAPPVPMAGLRSKRGFLPVVADRLRLPGDPANVDLSGWLDAGLWMAYVEPSSLRSLPRRAVTWPRPRQRRLTSQEKLLLKKWLRIGRLLLVDAEALPAHRFSALAAVPKDAGEDRQIVDRRGANGEEDRLEGPSVFLPSGADLVDIALLPSESLACAGSDLAHCYHHVAVSQERAFTNPVGQSLPFRRWGLEGFGPVAMTQAALRSRAAGGASFPPPLRAPPGLAAPLPAGSPAAACFDGLPMGDHGAVEFVHAAHGALLERAGLLGAREVRGGQPLPRGGEYHLRCIDDLKILCKVPRGLDLTADVHDRRRPDRAALDAALAQYKRSAWPVAAKKVVVDVASDLVLGAEVEGDAGLVGAPRQRRFVLMVLLLRAARLRWHSAAEMEALLGNLTYCFLFRRPLLAVLQESFRAAAASPGALAPLPRRTASELILGAVLLLVASADLRAPVVPAVWASDASPSGGGLVRAPLSPAQAADLYRRREKRGGYSRLEHPLRTALRSQGLLGSPGSVEEAAFFPTDETVRRPLAYSFDFLEVCCGAAYLTDRLAPRGWRVGPPLDLSASRWFDLRDARVFEWLVWLVMGRRLRALSFSASFVAEAEARRQPGYVPTACGESLLDPRTWKADRAGDVALYLLRCALRVGIAAVDELFLPLRFRRRAAWQVAARRLGLGLTEVHACAFGAPQKRPALLLSANLDLSSFGRRCPGFHAHEAAGGVPWGCSVAAWPPLADALAEAVHLALVRAAQEARAVSRVEPPGYEKVAVNLLADTLPWRLERRWAWRGPAHINLLEQRAIHAFCKERVRRGEAGRCSILVDSRVVLCSGAKGRSASRALGARWRATLPWIIGGRLYLGFHFVPTRKNPSDAPSRFRPLAAAAGEPPVGFDQFAGHEPSVWDDWWAVPPLRRAPANWAQLVLRLVSARLRREELRDWPPTPVATDGEASNPGPRPSNWQPREELPGARAASLAAPEVSRRAALFDEFVQYLGGALVAELAAEPARMAEALEAFGRHVYRAVPRRPLADYVRTILAVVDRFRHLRRLLGQAWDFAALWKMEEPGKNNLAMPPVVLRAFVATALFWNWPRMALMIGLGFAGMLRPTEYLLAPRRLLVLPRDVQGLWYRCYVRVPLPKSRWAAARRQLARVDDWWVTLLAEKLVGADPPDARLWPASPAAFRRRWNAIADVLGVDRKQGVGLTPASLRAGGATAHYELFENPETLRRRGRWRRADTLEIYVQEVAPQEFLANLPRVRRDAIFAVAAHFESMLFSWLRATPAPSAGRT